MDKKNIQKVNFKPFIMFMMMWAPILVIGYIVLLSIKKDIWETGDDTAEKINARTKARGQFISICLMLSALIQAGMKEGGAEENSLLLLYGFIFAGVLGYLGDIAIGTDEGLSSFKKGIGSGTRYVLGSLATGKFYRYIITVLLDMFISTPIQKVLTYLMSGTIAELKKGNVGMDVFNNGGKLGKYTKFIGANFDNILQSFVGMITFMAYTNETRFLWAYPSSSLRKSDIIPTSTIKLATSIAAVVFLISNYPNTYNKVNSKDLENLSNDGSSGSVGSGGLLETFKNFFSLPIQDAELLPGKPMGDTLSRKFIFVLVAIILLTAGSKDYLNMLDPQLDYTVKEDIEKVEAEENDIPEYEYIQTAEKNKDVVTKEMVEKRWLPGLGIFGVLCLVGVIVPFILSYMKKDNRKKSPLMLIVPSVIVVVIITGVGLVGGLAK